ncbi:hypothetical protein Tco_0892633 [Tanacetum coccineum]|uniref:Uncharacterized protein n=1 Tax=Tanacetum coccineum TaxID=301880 RepID=A0ABQ5C9P1_9ASTR
MLYSLPLQNSGRPSQSPATTATSSPPPEKFSGGLFRPTPRMIPISGSIRPTTSLSSTRHHNTTTSTTHRRHHSRHGSPPHRHHYLHHHHITTTTIFDITRKGFVRRGSAVNHRKGVLVVINKRRVRVVLIPPPRWVCWVAGQQQWGRGCRVGLLWVCFVVKTTTKGWFGSAIIIAGGGGVRRLGFNHPPGDLGSGRGSGDSRGGCRDRGVSGQARDSGVGMGLTANGGFNCGLGRVGLRSNRAPTSMSWSSSTGMVAVRGATGDGTVNDIRGDEMGDGTSECDREMGSELGVQSGEGGVCTCGAGGG